METVEQARRRANRALARVKERLGVQEPESEDWTQIRTMRLVLGVTITNTNVRFADGEAQPAMEDRVINALIPHPDDSISTGHGTERVTMIATEWETTS